MQASCLPWFDKTKLEAWVTFARKLTEEGRRYAAAYIQGSFLRSWCDDYTQKMR